MKILVKISYFLIPAILFCATFFILWSLAESQPLGHDEAVYLTKARSWIEETPADEFQIYRPIGMAISGWIVLHLGYSEHIIRIFGVIFGSLTIFFLYLFFKKVFNIWVSLGIVGVVASSYLFLQQAPLFQNDVPSSGLLIAALWLIYIYYETDGKSKSIYFAPFLAALAFYTRYGVATTLGIIGILTLVILFPKFRKKKEVDYSKLKKSFIISVILFTPHFIYSYFMTDSFFGILSLSGKVAGRKYLGEGLINYIKLSPNEIGGRVLLITAIIGILIMFVVVISKNLRKNYINILWIGNIGLLNFIITGLLVHAEVRYIFFSMVLLSGVGIAGIYYLVKNFVGKTANLLIIIFVSGVLYLGANYYRETSLFFKLKETDRYRVGYVKTSEFIRNENINKNGCAIWAVTTYRPAVSWYSKCSTLSVTNVTKFEEDFNLNLGKNHYSVVLDKVKSGQINQDNADKFGVILTEIFRTQNLSRADRGDIIVYRITKKEDTGDEKTEKNKQRNWIIEPNE